MKRVLGVLLLGVVLISCKSKKIVLEKCIIHTPATEDSSVIISHRIVQFQKNTKNDFSTLYIKSNIIYQDENKTHKVEAEIKILKDTTILISMKFFGITMAKAIIKPNEVKYYEKLNKTYFEGNFEKLSEWLGTELDFYKIQNMLVGQPFEDIQNKAFSVKKSENTYQLENTEDINTIISYFFNSKNLEFEKQQVTQIQQNRNFQISYKDFKEYNKLNLPLQHVIQADKGKDKTLISLEYVDVKIDEKITFPYSVPDGYERISIN